MPTCRNRTYTAMLPPHNNVRFITSAKSSRIQNWMCLFVWFDVSRHPEGWRCQWFPCNQIHCMIVFENRFAIIMNYKNWVSLYDWADFFLSMRRGRFAWRVAKLQLKVKPWRFFIFGWELMFAKGPTCRFFCLGFLSSFTCPNVPHIGPHFCQARKVNSIIFFRFIHSHFVFIHKRWHSRKKSWAGPLVGRGKCSPTSSLIMVNARARYEGQYFFSMSLRFFRLDIVSNCYWDFWAAH